MAIIRDPMDTHFQDIKQDQRQLSDICHSDLQTLRKYCSMMYERLDNKGALDSSGEDAFREILHIIQKIEYVTERRDDLDQFLWKRLQEFFNVMEKFGSDFRFERK